MPSFYRKTTTSKIPSTQRKFVAHREPIHAVRPRVVRPLEPPDEDMKPTRIEPHEVKRVHEEKNDEFEPQNHYVKYKAAQSLDALDELLHSTPKTTAATQVSDEEDDNAVYQDEEAVEFDGVSDEDEQEELYSEAIDYERKKAKAVVEHLKMFEEEREQERRSLEQEIKKLKQELHRTVPIQDNKFFSLSKQLREAVKEIETLAASEGITVSSIPTPASTLPVKDQPSPIFSQKPPVEPVVEKKAEVVLEKAGKAVKEVKEAAPAEPETKKSLPKKKMLITGAAAIIVLMVISGTLVRFLTAEPKVDEELVKQYLPAQSGQVQGIQTATKGENSQGQTQTAKTDPSQANVTFEESIWEEFKDPTFGILLQYPKNAVKPIRTESNVTFIRKTGYLFKVQRIETALTLEEYWKQIKATSLNYSVTEEKFKGKPAFKLELEDLADYPGDRYLIKEGNFIYDIWYATPSNSFAKDDVLRAEKMLSSLSVVGNQQ